MVYTSEKWYDISFADESPEYQMVLVKAEDFIAMSENYENMPAVTAEDAKLALIDQLYAAYDGIDEAYYVALDDTTEEMNLIVELTIPTYCKDVDEWIVQTIADNDFENYQLFYIEKVEDKSDEENSYFRVTYGHLQKFVQ